MSDIPPAGGRRFRTAIAFVMLCLAAIALAACGSSSSSSNTTESTASGESTGSSEPAASNESSSGGESEAGSKSPITIGAAVAKTGVIAQYDTQALHSMELELKKANAEGGIEGRPLKLIVQDTHSDISRTPQVAESLISEGAEIMVVSCDFNYGSPAALVAQREGMVSFTLCATSPKFGVQGIGDKAYDVNVSGGNIGAVMAAYAMKAGLKNAYVLTDKGLESMITQCGAFTEAWKEKGGTIVGSNTFNNTDPSIAPEITQIQQANPGFLVACTFPPGGASALRQIRAAGLDLPIISGDGLDGTEWVKAVPTISDLWIVAHASIFGGSPEIAQILKEYKATYHSSPTGGFAITGYSTGQVIVEALKKNGGSAEGESLKNVLNEFTEFPTANGPVTFTPETHIQLERPLPVIRFTNGKPAYVETVEPEVPVDLGFGGT